MRNMSTKQAAAELGVNDSRVRQLIYAGRLKAERVGWEWLIHPRSLDAVRGFDKSGRRCRKGKEKGHAKKAKA